ncbi:hypothetical protein SLS60_009439 [Paraconiothyrium brasiliense]|uniref:HpcH/HpaI aldolase/citrate lyase domain-containing protein n=1 Tax=Paraconiothyrium brasiliense TaxID=300254 RepID=A0ABR3QUA3_9PLEO
MERFNPVPTMTEYLQQANDSLLTMVQIETQEAVDNVEEIAAVPGIDLLFVGPFDLGNNIGHPILDGVMKPELEQAVEKVLEATHKAGKKAGFFASSPEQAKKYADKGFDMVSAALDTTLLQASLATSLSIARGAVALEKVQGLTTAIAKAAGAAFVESYVKDVKKVAFASLGFGGLAIIACFLSEDIGLKVNEQIEVFLENEVQADSIGSSWKGLIVLEIFVLPSIVSS